VLCILHEAGALPAPGTAEAKALAERLGMREDELEALLRYGEGYDRMIAEETAAAPPPPPAPAAAEAPTPVVETPAAPPPAPATSNPTVTYERFF
jgi:hypothetical protein